MARLISHLTSGARPHGDGQHRRYVQRGQ